jgi:hypothetical protein
LPNVVWEKLHRKCTDIEWKKIELEFLVQVIKMLQSKLMKIKEKNMDINIVVRYRLLKVIERHIKNI